jgi:YARHG domain-containing protein
MEANMRSSMLLSIGFASALFGVLSATTPARANVCDDLWVQRNSIYKEYGYCFKTPRAIGYFGNAGCQYDNEGDIPLSRADRSLVLAIKHKEKSLGCL